MSLDPGEAARLEQIERQLLSDAPGLVAAFERWTPTDDDGGRPAVIAPGLVLAAFLIGFVTWFGGPTAGLLVAVAGLWVWWARRPSHDPAPRDPTPRVRRHPFPPGPHPWPGFWGPL